MKRITSIIAGSLFTVLIAGGTFPTNLHAQSEPGLTFSVPFAFWTNGHHIPAGTYQVTLDSGQFLISIRNIKTGAKQLFSVRPEQRGAITERGVLVFHNCGERKDLTEFHIPGTDAYSATMTPHGAGNIEANNCRANDTMTLAAR
jgi:hypothetical protein